MCTRVRRVRRSFLGSLIVWIINTVITVETLATMIDYQYLYPYDMTIVGAYGECELERGIVRCLSPYCSLENNYTIEILSGCKNAPYFIGKEFTYVLGASISVFVLFIMLFVFESVYYNKRCFEKCRFSEKRELLVFSITYTLSIVVDLFIISVFVYAKANSATRTVDRLVTIIDVIETLLLVSLKLLNTVTDMLALVGKNTHYIELN